MATTVTTPTGTFERKRSGWEWRPFNMAQLASPVTDPERIAWLNRATPDYRDLFGNVFGFPHP